MSQVQFDYPLQDATGATCTAHAWAKVPEPLSPEGRQQWKAKAKALLAQHNAVLVAHYYVDGNLQDLALETGGCVSDSLEMARFGRDHAAKTLVVAGVRAHAWATQLAPSCGCSYSTGLISTVCMME